VRALAIVGPTASGKTRLSIPVARRLGAEIVSMDSRQVYRGMDVGTAKVPAEARDAVPHHGLDLVAPDERYSAGRFARDARTWLRAIQDRGRVPLLVGGTGFFLRALTDPVFREPKVDGERRDRLRARLRAMPVPEMARWVRALDPERAPLAEEGGRQRLSRALEVPLLTGRPLSWWHRTAPAEGEAVEVSVAVLSLPREELYRRIDARAEEMFRTGLLEEVRGLLAGGVREDDPGMTGTGYREAVAVVRGEIDVPQAVDRVQRATRAYARRQLTWFRNQLTGPALFVDAISPLEDQAATVVEWWKGIGAGTGG
jgi:tRNA dimethylallyltransferase